MKTIKFKFHFVLGCLLFCFNSFVHSQCDIKFYKKQKGDLIFHSAEFTDSLQCNVRVCLTYYINFAGRYERTGIDIKDIELRTKSKNPKSKNINYSDTAYQCIRDTLIKYIYSYYNDRDRILTVIELQALETDGRYCYTVKVELPLPFIYIYPYRKNKKSGLPSARRSVSAEQSIKIMR